MQYPVIFMLIFLTFLKFITQDIFFDKNVLSNIKNLTD